PPPARGEDDGPRDNLAARLVHLGWETAEDAAGMQVGEIMGRDIASAEPDATVQHAAKTMADGGGDVGVGGCDERVVGVLTLRDILIRLVAPGFASPDVRVGEIMSSTVYTCRENEDAAEVAARMDEHRVRRMPALDAAGRLVGLVLRRAVETG